MWNGPGTPVVLVSGLGVSGRYWRRLGRRLGGRFEVLAPDLPGFGRTPAVPGSRWPAGPDVREQADRLLAWLDARGIGRAVLVGHSVGCLAVVDLAARFPDRAERLVLAALPFEPGRRSLAACLLRLFWAAAFERPSLPPRLIAEYLATGPIRAGAQAVRSMHYPTERVLATVGVAALVLHGERDPLVSRQWARAVAALLPRAALVEMVGVGHALHDSAPTATANLIERFLSGELDAAEHRCLTARPTPGERPWPTVAATFAAGTLGLLWATGEGSRARAARRASTGVALAALGAVVLARSRRVLRSRPSGRRP